MQNKNTEYKDLGCANGWKTSPREYIECNQLNHQKTERTLGNCYAEYSCEICKLKYTVDSSD